MEPLTHSAPLPTSGTRPLSPPPVSRTQASGTQGPPPSPSDTTRLQPPSGGSARSAVSLDLDDPHPGAPDKTPEVYNRHPQRGRDLYIPGFAFGPDGPRLVNPLPASGLSTNEDGLVLENAQTNSRLNFASIDAPHQAVASLYDHLSQKFPELESSVVWRLAKVGTFVAIDVPLMVASHEMGHGGAMSANCPSCQGTVVVTGWMSGYTRYNIPPGSNLTEKQRLFTSVAGMNQATFNGEEINRRMHTQGADVADAVQYLVNITNNMNYQVKDWIKNSPPGYNDGATYHRAIENRANGWNQANLSMLAVGVNLLNADFWASLIGSVNYIATGEQVRLPELQIGQAHVSLPHFSLMNTWDGPQLNVSLFGHLKGPETLELKYSQILTSDVDKALGLELRLHHWQVPGTQNQVSVSPRLGLSTYQGELGFKIGSSINYRPNNNPHVALSFGADYTHNYMPEFPIPNSGLGYQVEGGLTFNL